MVHTLIIRADANHAIGTGHLMRCMALAQGWKEMGGVVQFLTTGESSAFQERLSEEGFGMTRLRKSYPDPEDLSVTIRTLAAHPGAWLVLDGYHFDPDYHRKVIGEGHRLLVIDDTAHLPHYAADIILNQNINAERLHYACEPYTRLLLGTQYGLLRSEFLSYRAWERRIPAMALKVLVTLGGSDPGNQTLKAIQALKKVNIPGLEAVVVAGAKNTAAQALQAAIADAPVRMRLICSALDMPGLMAWADVAVSGAGSTCWELAFMGLPALVLVLARNQEPIAQGLAERGIVLSMGAAHTATSDTIAGTLRMLCEDQGMRERMSRAGRALVDGRGRERVLAVLQN